MATTLDQIAGFLTSKDLKFNREYERGMIVVPFRHEDDSTLMVVVRLEENGEFLKIFTPKLFTYQDGPNKLALMEALLLTSWETKMLQWEYDPTDGEVRAIVEFPIEDAQLTLKQFSRAFDGLLQLVTRFYPRLKKVIETGEDPTRRDRGGDDDLSRAFRDFVDGGDGSGSDSGGTGGLGGGGDAPDAL
jgi:hypothetical protein